MTALTMDQIIDRYYAPTTQPVFMSPDEWSDLVAFAELNRIPVGDHTRAILLGRRVIVR